jgi:N-glycosylase/DNA lyase
MMILSNLAINKIYENKNISASLSILGYLLKTPCTIWWLSFTRYHTEVFAIKIPKKLHFSQFFKNIHHEKEKRKKKSRKSLVQKLSQQQTEAFS